MIRHLQNRDKRLEPFGWKGSEAEWIALVCLHSGVFTRAQFRSYLNAGDVRASQRRTGVPLIRLHFTCPSFVEHSSVRLGVSLKGAIL